jgi:hypothetical protein
MTEPGVMRDRLREIADSIDVGTAGQKDSHALLDLADWFDEQSLIIRASEQLGGIDFESATPDEIVAHIRGTALKAHDTQMGDEFAESWEGVKGGQGRTAASVEEDAVGMFAIIAWVVIVVLLALAAGVFWVVL